MITVPIVIFLDIDGVLLPFPTSSSSSSSSSSLSNNSSNTNNNKKTITTTTTVLPNSNNNNDNTCDTNADNNDDNNSDNNDDNSTKLKDDINNYNNNNNENMIDNNSQKEMSGTFPDCTVGSLSMILEMLLTTYNSTWIQRTTTTTTTTLHSSPSTASSTTNNKLSSSTITTKETNGEMIVMKNDNNNDNISTDIDIDATTVKNHTNENNVNNDSSSDKASSIRDHPELLTTQQQHQDQSCFMIDIQIVLSSTWRVYQSSIEEILNNFHIYYTKQLQEQQQLHIKNSNDTTKTILYPFQFITKFYDTTNVSIHRERSYEIYDWLETNHPHRSCRRTNSQSTKNSSDNNNKKKYNRHDNNKRSKCTRNEDQSSSNSNNKITNVVWIAIDDENLIKECSTENYFNEFVDNCCIRTTSSIGLTKNDAQVAIQSIQRQISILKLRKNYKKTVQYSASKTKRKEG